MEVQCNEQWGKKVAVVQRSSRHIVPYGIVTGRDQF